MKCYMHAFWRHIEILSPLLLHSIRDRSMTVFLFELTMQLAIETLHLNIWNTLFISVCGYQSSFIYSELEGIRTNQKYKKVY